MGVNLQIYYEIDSKSIQEYIDINDDHLSEYLPGKVITFLREFKEYFERKLIEFNCDFDLHFYYEKLYLYDEKTISNELHEGLISAWVDETSSENPHTDLITFFDSLDDFYFEHPTHNLIYKTYDLQDNNYIFLV